MSKREESRWWADERRLIVRTYVLRTRAPPANFVAKFTKNPTKVDIHAGVYDANLKFHKRV